MLHQPAATAAVVIYHNMYFLAFASVDGQRHPANDSPPAARSSRVVLQDLPELRPGRDQAVVLY